ncbi:hypothetical protein F2Q70_00021319 [Brassica cretica]|uniref:DUF4283 domain-containing protein n=1 Tax=Brassica cretica TaxID=69181 RepID=A0A8S9GRQ2_BRACR|nr:hypothetical protein F2Q70_00021319 [Brassica cretica]
MRRMMFRSILALLFFLRFWLMLGAASPWIETNSGMVPWFADFVSSPLPFMLFHLVAAFITARISGGSPFRYVCQSSCPCWYRERELKLRTSDHERKQAVVASGIESSIASWLRSCLGIELRRSEVVSWDRVTNGNKMRIRFRVRDREFSTVRVYRRGDYGFVG